MQQKIAILTGASGQLGGAFLSELVRQNYIVYAVDLNVSGILENKLIIPVKLDITIEKSVHEFYRNIKRVDVLINNAGIGVFTKFEDRTAEEFTNVLKVNLLGTFLMAQGAIKLMKMQDFGKIINIGSIYGQVSSDERIYGESGRNNSEVYSATKAGVINMTQYMATHFGRYNIQTNCLSPGGVYNNQKEDFVKNYIYKTPMGRMGTIEDMVGALKYLIDESNTYLNGQNITVDGGFTAW